MVPFCLHAVANTPAGLMEFIRSYDSISFGLPTNRGGSAPALSVSGPAQRSLTLRPARSPSRLATLCTRGFSSLVASTAALIATGWSEPVPGRVYPRCGPPPFHGAPGNPTNQDLAFYGQMELESGVWEIEHRRLLQRRFLLSVSLADCLLHRLSEVKLLAACHIIGLWLAQAVHHLGKSGPISFYSSGLEAALFYFFGHSD